MAARCRVQFVKRGFSKNRRTNPGFAPPSGDIRVIETAVRQLVYTIREPDDLGALVRRPDFGMSVLICELGRDKDTLALEMPQRRVSIPLRPSSAKSASIDRYVHGPVSIGANAWDKPGFRRAYKRKRTGPERLQQKTPEAYRHENKKSAGAIRAVFIIDQYGNEHLTEKLTFTDIPHPPEHFGMGRTAVNCMVCGKTVSAEDLHPSASFPVHRQCAK